jgi:hypothetical protein
MERRRLRNGINVDCTTIHGNQICENTINNFDRANCSDSVMVSFRECRGANRQNTDRKEESEGTKEHREWQNRDGFASV